MTELRLDSRAARCNSQDSLSLFAHMREVSHIKFCDLSLTNKGVCVCVSQPLFQRVLCFCSATTAGGHSSIHQSVANEATDVWRGYEPGTPGSRTCDYFELLPTLFQSLLFASMVVPRYLP